MVSHLPDSMQAEWLLPKFLLCGGFTDNLVLSYLWYLRESEREREGGRGGRERGRERRREEERERGGGRNRGRER